MNNLAFGLELKAVSEAGTFEGLASTYGNIDHARDIVLPGAFAKTLAARGSEVPVLWAHDHGNPVGLGVLSDTDKGLAIRGTLDLDVLAGREAHSRLTKRIVRGLSIGYAVPEGGAEIKDGVRRLKALDLFEVSLVAVPCNDQARVTAVKGSIGSIRDFERFLHQAGWSRNESRALATKGWAGLADGSGEDADELAILDWLRTQTV